MGLHRGKGPLHQIVNHSKKPIRGEVGYIDAGVDFEATMSWVLRNKGLFNRGVLALANEQQDDGAEIGEQVGAVGPEEDLESDLRVESPTLESLTVSDLKEKCQDLGLKTGGNKAELIARLSEAGTNGAN